MAIKQDLNVFQGDTYEFEVVFNPDDPDPITDYTARLQVRDAPGGSVLYFTATDADDIVIDEAERTYAVTLTDENTALLDKSVLYYDLRTESPGGVVTYLVYGKVLVTPRVTLGA